MRPSKAFWRISAALFAASGIAALVRLMRRPIDGVVDVPDMIEEAGLESFPASDPPSWTLGEER